MGEKRRGKKQNKTGDSAKLISTSQIQFIYEIYGKLEIGIGRQTAAVEQPRINRGSKIGTCYNAGRDLLLIQMRQEPGLQTDTDNYLPSLCQPVATT
jgi:hypothetical protein